MLGSGGTSTVHAGDVLLQLDDGSTFRCHSQLLALVSTVWRDALACASQAMTSDSHEDLADHGPASKRARTESRLPLQGTSRMQVQLLLQFLYSWTRDTFLQGLQLTELLELAIMADRFGCQVLVQLLDKQLVRAESRQSSTVGSYQGEDRAAARALTWLSVQNAPARHRLARKLQLPELEEYVGKFMGQHALELDLEDVEPSIAGVLRGTLRLYRQLLRQAAKM